MSGAQDVLGAEEHARVFETKILPRSGLDRLASHPQPRAIFLGGQPGAGKGGLERSVKESLGADAITIDPDELRDYHPRAQELREQNPRTWSGRTHPDASAWAKELGERAVAGRKNIIFDTTLSNGDHVAKQIEDLRAKGYEPEVRVMATHRLESEAGVEKRFIEQFKREGYGRDVPPEFQDKAYGSVPKSLDTIQEKTGVRIQIYDREGRQWYDSHEPGETRKPGQVLEDVREARLRDPAVVAPTKRTYDETRAWHDNMPASINDNPHVPPAVKRTLPVETERAGVLPRLRENGATVDGLHASLARGAATDVERAGSAEGVEAALGGGSRAGLSGLGRVAGTAGGALALGGAAYDAYQTGKEYAALSGKGNATGADALLRQYEGRTAGGILGGIGAGAVYGALAGSETGPGAIATGVVGGVVGAFAGEKLANKITEYKVDHQTGADGRTYSFDHGQWTSTEHHVDWKGTWLPHLAGGTTAAPESQRAVLDYKRTAAVTELALAHPRQQDTRNITLGDAEWHASHGTWTRQSYDGAAVDPASGILVPQIQPADARTAATLDRLAANRQYNNDHYAGDVARAYVMDHYGKGWNKVGPLPDAVASELHRPSETNVKDPATGQSWTADGHGHFTRNTYVPTMTGGLVAVPVTADPQETARLDRVRVDAVRSNAAYGAQAIHEAYRKTRSQTEAQAGTDASTSATPSRPPAAPARTGAEDQRAVAARLWNAVGQRHLAAQEQQWRASAPDRQAGQAPAAPEQAAVRVQGIRRGP